MWVHEGVGARVLTKRGWWWVAPPLEDTPSGTEAKLRRALRPLLHILGTGYSC